MKSKKRTDTQMLDFIERNEATLSFATSEPRARRFRCKVSRRWYPTPDFRERAESVGFGVKARTAIARCMEAACE